MLHWEKVYSMLRLRVQYLEVRRIHASWVALLQGCYIHVCVALNPLYADKPARSIMHCHRPPAEWQRKSMREELTQHAHVFELLLSQPLTFTPSRTRFTRQLQYVSTAKLLPLPLSLCLSVSLPALPPPPSDLLLISIPLSPPIWSIYPLPAFKSMSLGILHPPPVLSASMSSSALPIVWL